MIHAFGYLKRACAEVNRECFGLEANIADAIVQAATEVIALSTEGTRNLALLTYTFVATWLHNQLLQIALKCALFGVSHGCSCLLGGRGEVR